jgi:hypothetical protein
VAARKTEQGYFTLLTLALVDEGVVIQVGPRAQEILR